jgi:hypothetical protein
VDLLGAGSWRHLREREQLDDGSAGRLHHVEFWETDIAAMRASLADYGVAVNERTPPGLTRCAPHRVRVATPGTAPRSADPTAP